MYSKLLKYLVVFSLAVMVLGTNVGCDTSDKEALYVLEQLQQSGAPIADIEFQNKTLVSSTDIASLKESVSAAQDQSESQMLIRRHINKQERIECILDEIETAYSENSDIRCSGLTLVEHVGSKGLTGVSDIYEYLSANQDAAHRQAFLNDYVDSWVQVGKIDRIEQGLSQTKRSQSVPLFGIFIRTMHNFPIMYEGETLVPTEDTNDLMERYHLSENAESKRLLVIDYLQD